MRTDVGIVEGLGLVDLLLQIGDPRAVGGLGLLSSAGPESLSPSTRTPNAAAAGQCPQQLGRQQAAMCEFT